MPMVCSIMLAMTTNAIKGSATMVIDLDGIIDVETVNGKDVYLPPFHIENCEAQFVPGEASYSSSH
jgi:hypothetical protein